MTRNFGWALLDNPPQDKILDIGWENYIKGRLGTQFMVLTASKTDEMVIEEFIPKDKYNVFVCLGSINFGTAEEIETQLQKITILQNLKEYTGDKPTEMI